MQPVRFQWAIWTTETALFSTCWILSTVDGRGWTAFNDEPAATGPLLLIGVTCAIKLSLYFLLFPPHAIVIAFTALGFWTNISWRTWWSPDFGSIVGVFSLFYRVNSLEPSKPASSGSVSSGTKGTNLVPWNNPATESGSDLSPNKGPVLQSGTYPTRIN